MSWELKTLKAPETVRNEHYTSDLYDVSITSFYGGEHRGRSLQLTQSAPRMDLSDPRGPRTVSTEYIHITRGQAMELAMQIIAWDTGVLSEHDPYGRQFVEQAERDDSC